MHGTHISSYIAIHGMVCVNEHFLFNIFLPPLDLTVSFLHTGNLSLPVFSTSAITPRSSLISTTLAVLNLFFMLYNPSKFLDQSYQQNPDG